MREDQQKTLKDKLKLLEEQHEDELKRRRVEWREEYEREKEEMKKKICSETDHSLQHLKVSGSHQSISASVGEDVTLNCSVDSHITPKHIEEVSWRKTDENILVLLYQNNETFSDSSDERYTDRVEFFTAEISKGNFSLRLKSVRTEDKGVYMCQVFAGGLSANATLVLEQLVVLPCYGDEQMEGLKVEWRRADSETLVHLYQDDESRPESQQQDYHNRAHFFTDQIQHGNFSLCLDNLRAKDEGQYTCTVYRNQTSVFSSETNLELRPKDTVFHLQMFLIFCPNMIMFLSFVLWGVSEGSLNESVSCCALYFLRPLMLLWAVPYDHMIKFTGKTKTFIQNCSYDTEYIVLSAVFYSGFITVAVLPVFLTLTRFNWDRTCGKRMHLHGDGAVGDLRVVVFSSEILFTLFLMILLVFEPYLGLTFKKMLYVFGSVGVVLLNSVSLMTELILKAVNGECAVGDLRVVVFSSESLLVFSLLILLLFEPWISDIKCRPFCQKAARTDNVPFPESNQNQDSQLVVWAISADGAAGLRRSRADSLPPVAYFPTPLYVPTFPFLAGAFPAPLAVCVVRQLVVWAISADGAAGLRRSRADSLPPVAYFPTPLYVPTFPFLADS
ncbi:butyrophilin 2 [Labeo rohita]|uniref:Butyrophilin 2 n=1 Tax=Labeo rohita TaxID=84645 RepID=A0A498NFZ9_LABRO|nr:butyrophilin 2 [Labeo rohita]